MVCSDGSCECAEGRGDCNGNVDDGCEMSLLDDDSHCGACGQQCVNGDCRNAVCYCSPGFAGCDDSPETVCETDTRRDPQHCGECGRDCRGGECWEGECQPAVVADIDAPVDHLCVGAGVAYFVVLPVGAPSAILASDLASGSSDPELLHVDDETIRELEFDGSHLFWISDTQVWGGDPAARSFQVLAEVPASEPGFRYMAVAESHVFVIRAGGALERLSKEGGPLSPVTTVEERAILASEGYVYGTGSLGEILRLPVDSDVPEHFDDNAIDGAAQARGGELFWLTMNDDPDDYVQDGLHLMRKAEPQDVATSIVMLPEDNTYDIHLAGEEIFIALREAGWVVRASADVGGAVTALVRGQPGVHDVAADDEWIYWLRDGGLMRALR
ncbi:MAG: hypothetical protein JRI23_28000 [Deltaproteobacteria bacterium]|nr:hypothetical protein [Deltaproteobacteria bacterium]MBW2535935.1 hypothetical protein [Deltaproteobacteria bacterium]